MRRLLPRLLLTAPVVVLLTCKGADKIENKGLDAGHRNDTKQASEGKASQEGVEQHVGPAGQAINVNLSWIAEHASPGIPGVLAIVLFAAAFVAIRRYRRALQRVVAAVEAHEGAEPIKQAVRRAGRSRRGPDPPERLIAAQAHRAQREH